MRIFPWISSRLISANCAQESRAQTFSYDPFGNISKSGSAQFRPVYNITRNLACTDCSVLERAMGGQSRRSRM